MAVPLGRWPLQLVVVCGRVGKGGAVSVPGCLAYWNMAQPAPVCVCGVCVCVCVCVWGGGGGGGGGGGRRKHYIIPCTTVTIE